MAAGFNLYFILMICSMSTVDMFIITPLCCLSVIESRGWNTLSVSVIWTTYYTLKCAYVYSTELEFIVSVRNLFDLMYVFFYCFLCHVGVIRRCVSFVVLHVNAENVRFEDLSEEVRNQLLNENAEIARSDERREHMRSLLESLVPQFVAHLETGFNMYLNMLNVLFTISHDIYSYVDYQQYTPVPTHEDNETGDVIPESTVVVTIAEEDISPEVFSREEYTLAFAMSLHPRLGTSCIFNGLDDEIIRFIIELGVIQSEVILNYAFKLTEMSEEEFQKEADSVLQYETKLIQLSRGYLRRQQTPSEIKAVVDIEEKWSYRISAIRQEQFRLYMIYSHSM